MRRNTVSIMPQPRESKLLSCAKPFTFKDTTIRTPMYPQGSDIIIPKPGKVHEFEIPWKDQTAKIGYHALQPMPCRECLPCRLNDSLYKCSNIGMEMQTHDSNMFVTITYDEEHVPMYFHANGYTGKQVLYNSDKIDRLKTLQIVQFLATLQKSHHRYFIKKLRENLCRSGLKDVTVRFFVCGEYGPIGKRPHYHYILFGLAEHMRGVDVKTIIEETAWRKGLAEAENCKQGVSAGDYVGDYLSKSMRKYDPRLKGREPEFHSCSTRPFLGKAFLDQEAANVRKYYTADYVREHHPEKVLWQKFYLDPFRTKYFNLAIGHTEESLSQCAYESLKEALDPVIEDHHGKRLKDAVIEATEQDRINRTGKYNLRRRNREMAKRHRSKQRKARAYHASKAA